MSYSYEVKSELVKCSISNTCCKRAEISGLVCFGALVTYTDANKSIQITTEHPKVASRIFTLFKEVYGIHLTLNTKGKQSSVYKLKTEKADDVELVLSDLQLIDNRNIRFRINEDVVMTECCVGSFLRGSFLAGGSLINPEKNYHLELTTGHYNLSKDSMNLMIRLDIKAKIVIRKSNYVVYIKDSEAIAEFLGVTGAHKAMMGLYNVKILKEVRNNVNRMVNCETCNIEKTSQASAVQIESIKKIEKEIGLDNLPDGLREIAKLRLAYPEANLKELGEMLKPPLGKSGANHRMNKLKKFTKGND